jgi:cell division septum initiation protein DivIVA
MQETVDAVSRAFDVLIETIDSLLKENAALKAELAQLSHNTQSKKLCDLECSNRKLHACSTCNKSDPANIGSWYAPVT